MNIKNIKSFIEFYKFLGITDCISQVQRNKMKLKVDPKTNIQEIKNIHIDCDKDTVLFEVKQTGGACHTGSKSCFFTKLL